MKNDEIRLHHGGHYTVDMVESVDSTGRLVFHPVDPGEFTNVLNKYWILTNSVNNGDRKISIYRRKK